MKKGLITFACVATVYVCVPALNISAHSTTISEACAITQCVDRNMSLLFKVYGSLTEAQIERLREKLNQAVADGDLSESDADKLLQGLSCAVDTKSLDTSKTEEQKKSARLRRADIAKEKIAAQVTAGRLSSVDAAKILSKLDQGKNFIFRK